MLKKVAEIVSILKKDIEGLKKMKIKFLEIKNTPPRMKNTLDALESRTTGKI